MKNELYPLKFEPILKEKIWGGEKLKKLFGKTSTSKTTGESWELSSIDGSVSKVKNGLLAGKNLLQLLDTYNEKLVGQSVFKDFGERFPLLFKFIDAKENLSLQVHPNDKLAEKRHNSFGKTEMWYVMQADENAGIYVGFKKEATQNDYLHHLEEESLEDIMNFETVKPGDVFFIKPGLVHAIGEGVLLAEIQQTSDITYRVFDWNRKDGNGNSRELHTEMALDAIDFYPHDFKIDYKTKKNRWQKLVENTYFTTRKIHLTKSISIDYSKTASFVVLMCIKGEITVVTDEKSKNESLKTGETLMIPACLKTIELETENAHLLEVSV